MVSEQENYRFGGEIHAFNDHIYRNADAGTGIPVT